MQTDPETSMTFWTQHQNNPRESAGTNKFNVKDIQYFEYIETAEGTFVKCLDNNKKFKLTDIQQYGFIDIGGFEEVKSTKRGSLNVITIAGRPRGETLIFVTWFWARQIQTYDEFLNELILAHESRHPFKWEIEIFGQHEWIRQTLIKLLEKKGKNIKILPADTKGRDLSDDAKNKRITALIPLFENHKIYLPKTAKYQELLSEIKDYPACMHKDGLDALGWLRQLHWSVRPKGSADEYNKRQHSQYLQQVRGSRTGY